MIPVLAIDGRDFLLIGLALVFGVWAGWKLRTLYYRFLP